MVTTVELERQVDDLYDDDDNNDDDDDDNNDDNDDDNNDDDDDDNNDDDDDDRRVGRVRGVASLRGIGNPSRGAKPARQGGSNIGEDLTSQKYLDKYSTNIQRNIKKLCREIC